MNRLLLLFVSVAIPLKIAASNNNPIIGAQAAALGGIASPFGDVWSAQNNQAGLGFIKKPSVGIYYANQFLVPELSTKAGAIAIPLKILTLGLSINSFGYSLYTENKYGLSVAKSFGNNLSMGIAFNCLNTRIADGYGNKAVLLGEFGILSRPTEKLSLGAHIYNPTRVKFVNYNNERIPTILNLGGNYKFSNKFNVSAETEKDISQKAVFKTGLEYQPKEGIFLRVGISNKPLLSTFGFGFKLKRFQVDIASNYHQTLGLSTQLGLVYTHD
jgi:hypothetical protein